MRPRRLELEGFASFRDRTSVDFGDAELFVLTGPTGSGKSSLIDAITFALYGAVPRYENKNLVWPIITQGKQEARVGLEFSLDGVSYMAARVVRRTKSGATTREARLERDGQVLAGNARELNEKIEQLLGLPFEHFTKCVVLPQGEFAQFLHAEPSKRQDLLVKLLDLVVYGRMAKAANLRAKEAEQRVEWCRERVQGLAGATPQAQKALGKRITALEKLSLRIEEAGPRLEELARRGASARQEAEEAAQRAAALAGLQAPEEAELLARRLGEAKARERKAVVELEAAMKTRREAEEARAELPGAEPLKQALQGYAESQRLRAELAEAEEELRKVRAVEEKAQHALAAATDQLVRAEARLAEATRRHLAVDLAAGLEAGDVCPVCGAVVEELPHAEPPRDLEAAREAKEKARAAEARAQERLRKARSDVSTRDGRLAERRRVLAELAGILAEAPPPGRVETELAAIAAADAALEEARQAQERSADALKAARDSLDELSEEREEAWRLFDAARDPVAGLGPPEVDREDLGGAWRQLVEWAERESPGHRREQAEAAKRAATSAGELETLRSEILSACAEAGLQVGDQELPRDVCTEALAGARKDLERLEEDIEEARRLHQEIKDRREAAHVARDLARHLGARRFESWLLHQAVRALLAAASEWLRSLSSGQYSLDLDEDGDDFLVVDHANADERRLARTLSGGETFLASLSLALALAEDVSSLAAHGAARLDALFLDEGFGTLDTETLEVVAAAIEELGARGHMVGLVTHVRELADRIPVRYEVRKRDRSSTVERAVA